MPIVPPMRVLEIWTQESFEGPYIAVKSHIANQDAKQKVQWRIEARTRAGGGNPNQFVRNSLTVYARVQYNAAVDSRCMSANPETGFMLCYVFGHDADAQGACGLACTAHENIPMSRKKLSPSCGSDGRWPWLGGCFVTTPSWLCFDDGCRGAVAPPYVTRNVPAAC